MFKLNERYEINRNIIKCDYISYLPSKISTKNTINSQISIFIPREVSIVSLLNSYHDLNFDVFYAATGNRYADGNDIRLINQEQIALFSNYVLTTSWRNICKVLIMLILFLWSINEKLVLNILLICLLASIVIVLGDKES